MYTLQDFLKMDFKAIEDNTQRRNRVMYGASDMILMFAMFGFFKIFLDH